MNLLYVLCIVNDWNCWLLHVCEGFPTGKKMDAKEQIRFEEGANSIDKDSRFLVKYSK